MSSGAPLIVGWCHGVSVVVGRVRGDVMQEQGDAYPNITAIQRATNLDV